RSCLGLTPALTARRLSKSRKAPKSHYITVRQRQPLLMFFSHEKVNPEHLALLLKSEWKLSYVTPLYQFRHTQLKSYSRQLSAFIAAEKQQGFAVEVDGSQSNFRVSFSVVQGMTETEDDAETVLIQVRAGFLRPISEAQRSVWSGWLTCVNGNSDYLCSLPKDFICLPLFGSSGSEVLTTLVQSWFQKMFDCCFGPLEMNNTCLQWLAALWTNCHPESSIQHLKMIWTLPVVPPLQITYTVNPKDAWKLWSSVRKDPCEENKEEEGVSIDIEDVMRFMQGLKSHFYRHFRLDLSAGCLKQVSTALGSATFSGRVKISNSQYILSTLTLLTECALFKMPV
uniref:Centromere protein L n=1 Tax=Echeneis naucrates TaxID=173247 RepID=A0A665UEP9_ECHNA